MLLYMNSSLDLRETCQDILEEIEKDG
jgi:hypothetical protein